MTKPPSPRYDGQLCHLPATACHACAAALPILTRSLFLNLRRALAPAFLGFVCLSGTLQAQPPEAVLVASVSSPTVRTQGQASWYGKELHQRRTASGERFDMHDLTAAHLRLPFGSQVCVRSLANGRTVKVRVNDRGPYTKKRIIDLSYAAAKALDMVQRGTKQVELLVLKNPSAACPGKS